MKLRSNIVGVALLCFAFGSEALTLGRVRGAALVGQHLDVVVPVQMDAGEDAASLCFDAEVFHGDTRQEASRVRVLIEATAQAQTANVRVVSSALIDEPVVTVYLRTGCGQKTTRRYVLLADFPSEVATPTVPPQNAAHIAASAPAQGVATPASPGSASATSTPVMPVPAAKQRKVRAPRPTVHQEAASKRPDAKAAVVSSNRTQSRLKLDPLELLSDRVADIDSYMTFTPPEDALRTMQKMQTLESDVKALLASATKSEASLLDLKARLQKAESERFPRGIIFGLIALVLVCLAAIAFLWTRQRRSYSEGGDWWHGVNAVPASASPEHEHKSLPESVDVSKPAEDGLPATKTEPSAAPTGVTIDAHLSSEPGVKLMEMSESDFDQLMQPEAAGRLPRKPPSPQTPAVVAQPGPAHLINSESTLDIRQQAEFFVSLGQTDRAMRILKKQIDEGEEPNPFVYLDLFSIFHSLGLKNEFQLLRKDFNLLFNGNVPAFALFKDEGRGLDAYPEFLSRITSLWPTPKALEVIEACIYQDPWDAKSQHFDLAAFRDLLLLHAIVQNVVLEPLPEISVTPDFSREPIQPLPALDLDLSDAELAEPAPHLLSTAAIDPSHMGNLINFDLPQVPPV